VEPQPALAAERGDIAQRIDRALSGGALDGLSLATMIT